MPFTTTAGATAAALALLAGLFGAPAHASGPSPSPLSSASQYAAPPAEAKNPFVGVAYATPAPGAKKVPFNTQVVVTFDHPVGNVSAATFWVTDASGARVQGDIFLPPQYGGGARENVFVFEPSTAFAKSTRYTVHLQGVEKVPTATWTFTTGTTRLYGTQY